MVRDSVDNANRQAIKDEFLQNLSAFVPAHGNWIKDTNRYRFDTIQKILADTQSNSIVQADMKEYIAGSSVVHCKDGWEFLGSSVDSLLKGREGHAVHLAYYAELRAAMSFLASFGIGVFQNRHCYVDASGTVVYRNANTSGTHDFVWQVLNRWSITPLRATDLIELVEVDGRKLRDWISADTAFLGPITAGNLAGNWMNLWSMDIQKLSDDRHIRNEGSYRPSNIDNTRRYLRNIENELDFVQNTWRSCEPNGSLRFGNLDLFLLREIIVKSYEGHFKNTPNNQELQHIYDRMIQSLGISRNTYTEAFLTKRINVNRSSIMEMAELDRLDPNGRPRPTSVISRAFMLLRIATSAVRDSMNYSNITFPDITSWTQYEGVKRGIWRPNEPIQDPDILWLDVEESNDSIQDFLSVNTITNYNVQHQIAPEINVLGQNERMFYWGIK